MDPLPEGTDTHSLHILVMIRFRRSTHQVGWSRRALLSSAPQTQAGGQKRLNVISQVTLEVTSPPHPALPQQCLYFLPDPQQQTQEFLKFLVAGECLIIGYWVIILALWCRRNWVNLSKGTNEIRKSYFPPAVLSSNSQKESVTQFG